MGQRGEREGSVRGNRRDVVGPQAVDDEDNAQERRSDPDGAAWRVGQFGMCHDSTQADKDREHYKHLDGVEALPRWRHGRPLSAEASIFAAREWRRLRPGPSARTSA